MKVTDPAIFLQAVFMNDDLPLSVRMRAAIELMPYRHPKLQVTAVVNEGSLAELLEKRLQRMAEMKLIGAKPTGEKVDARLAPPIPDKRFRRI